MAATHDLQPCFASENVESHRRSGECIRVRAIKAKSAERDRFIHRDTSVRGIDRAEKGLFADGVWNATRPIRCLRPVAVPVLVPESEPFELASLCRKRTNSGQETSSVSFRFEAKFHSPPEIQLIQPRISTQPFFDQFAGTRNIWKSANLRPVPTCGELSQSSFRSTSMSNGINSWVRSCEASSVGIRAFCDGPNLPISQSPCLCVLSDPRVGSLPTVYPPWRAAGVQSASWLSASSFDIRHSDLGIRHCFVIRTS